MVKRFLRLMAIHARMDLAWLLRDTKFAIFAITSDFISNISSITGVFLLAWRFDGIGGMDKFEVLFMLGFVNVVFGLLFLLAGNNNLYVSRIIGRGQLEHMFIQPVPIGVQLLTCGFFPFTCSAQFMTGVGVCVAALYNLSININILWVLLFMGFVLVSSLIVVALCYLASSITFYAPVQCEEITTHVMDSLGHTSTFPLSGMPSYLKLPLITIFPAGLISWFPSMILMGKDLGDLPTFLPLVIAAILCILAGLAFKKGMNYYVKKGINRYTSAGRN